jgi:chaperonin cofactor prefoldin
MADLVPKTRWLDGVKEDSEVQRKWLLCQIQEKKSAVIRLNQDIEDLLKGKIVALEAHIIMLEKEIKVLEAQLNSIDITNI